LIIPKADEIIPSLKDTMPRINGLGRVLDPKLSLTGMHQTKTFHARISKFMIQNISNMLADIQSEND
jgi:hypothetical protein